MAGRIAYNEDCVEYWIFPAVPESIPQVNHSRYLEEQQDSYVASLSQLLVDYIWQNEPFQLQGVPASTESGPPHLYGKTNYGDNVEDEWFIVYLLHQLTQKFPGLVVKVNDNDGEFLLIEAANSIPKWLQPNTAENRIYIYQGRIHIIPLPQSPSEVTIFPTGTPSIQEAVTCIRNYHKLTVASEKIQKDIYRRIGDFPEKIYQFLHRTHAYIPANLAAVLDHTPALVAPMVHAFYLRDPVDLRSCVTMTHFRPGTRVMREVKMTRCLYAQLMQQRFQPDKRSGFSLPATSNPKFKAHDLGSKLAHGAEILCSKCDMPSPSSGPQRTSQQLSRWTRFLNALTDKGYFRGEIQGSNLYKKLLDDAKKYFYTTVITDKQSSGGSGEKVLGLLREVTYDIEAMRKEDLRPPDDDRWLDLSPGQLDEMLNELSGQQQPQPQSPDSFDMTSMTDSMRSFMSSVSSYEGAEVSKSVEDSDVHLDPNSFIQTMQKMFEFEDTDGSSSDMGSEYGSDEELELPNRRAKTTPSAGSGGNSQHSGATPDEDVGDFLGMKQYMNLMDHELSSTQVGKSFEKTPVSKPAAREKPKAKPKAKDASSSSSSNSSPSKSTEPAAKKMAPRATLDDDFADIDELDDDDDFRPVNVDINMVKNLLESYNSQQGLSGPTSNMLGSMGIRLPPDTSLED